MFDVSDGPGVFRKLRKASGISFYIFWYLSDFMVPSQGQKDSIGQSFSPAPYEDLFEGPEFTAKKGNKKIQQ